MSDSDVTLCPKTETDESNPDLSFLRFPAKNDDIKSKLNNPNTYQLDIATRTIVNAGNIHGWHFLEDEGGLEVNTTQATAHLLKYMPRRDMMTVLGLGYAGLSFLLEHVRMALKARRDAQRYLNYSMEWDIFADYVLPYSVLDEKLDMNWNWRQRLHQSLVSVLRSSTNLTMAVHKLVETLPFILAEGALALGSSGDQQSRMTYGGGHSGASLVPGNTFDWVSETAPGYLSPQQVCYFGGSCTGTGILLVKAARAIGIPARLAGCSESVPNDDHHWVEFRMKGGPFGDNWQTREGVSVGNENGPWNSPSQPMRGCLKALKVDDSFHTIWATKWSSEVFLPTLWHGGASDAFWGFVGGENRCGAYCTAWGCGDEQQHKYTQEECQPPGHSHSNRQQIGK